MLILYVGAGGFLGSVARYLLTRSVNRIFDNNLLPYGTVAVNITGCLIIGLAAGLVGSRQLLNEKSVAFLFAGILGGFTTFSAFGLETYSLLRDGNMVAALSNIALQVLLGVGAVWLGFSLSRVA